MKPSRWIGWMWGAWIACAPMSAQAQHAHAPTLYVYELDGERVVTSAPLEQPGQRPVRVLRPTQTMQARWTDPKTQALSEEKAQLIRWAVQYARAHQLEPALVCGVIQVESNWNIWATSPKGAAGLTQIMPHLWHAHGLDNPWAPESNIATGTAYLAHMMRRYRGRLDWALAAYNAGPGKVRAHQGPPPSTQSYIRAVMRARARWRLELERLALAAVPSPPSRTSRTYRFDP